MSSKLRLAGNIVFALGVILVLSGALIEKSYGFASSQILFLALAINFAMRFGPENFSKTKMHLFWLTNTGLTIFAFIMLGYDGYLKIITTLPAILFPLIIAIIEYLRDKKGRPSLFAITPEEDITA